MQNDKNGPLQLPGGGVWLRKGHPQVPDTVGSASNRVYHSSHYHSTSKIGGGGSPLVALPVAAAVVLILKLILVSNSGSRVIEHSSPSLLKTFTKEQGWQKSAQSEEPNWQYYRDYTGPRTSFGSSPEQMRLEELLHERSEDIIDIGSEKVDTIDDDDDK